MPDIQMRFHTDMLVLTAPLDATLEAQGIDEQADRDSLVAFEPETVLEALRVQAATGAQCLLAPTRCITRAQLAHLRLSEQQAELAKAAVDVVKRLNPQHIMCPLGPTGLPLDLSSKTSMQANRDQYAQACEALQEAGAEAILLDAFTSTDDLLCALMGVRKVSDIPLFASVLVDAKGALGAARLEEAIELMDEYEADVMGIATSAPVHQAAQLVERACRTSELPLLVQLQVGEQDYDEQTNPYADPDTLIAHAMRLRDAGVQFLQATGHARARHTGALVAATMGLDAIR